MSYSSFDPPSALGAVIEEGVEVQWDVGWQNDQTGPLDLSNRVIHEFICVEMRPPVCVRGRDAISRAVARSHNLRQVEVLMNEGDTLIVACCLSVSIWSLCAFPQGRQTRSCTSLPAVRAHSTDQDPQRPPQRSVLRCVQTAISDGTEGQ